MSDIKAYIRAVAGAVDALEAFLQSEVGLEHPHVFDALLKELNEVQADIAHRKIDHALKRWRRDVRPEFTGVILSFRNYDGQVLVRRLKGELEDAYALQGRRY